MNTTIMTSAQVHQTPNCKALFLGFMKLGLMGFGGVLPLARHMIVEDQKWLSEEKFTNLCYTNHKRTVGTHKRSEAT